MPLWVANPTNQDHTFLMLRIGQDGARRRYVERPLPAGGQIMITNVDTPEISITIEHYRMYGARTVAEAKREKAFIGLIYSDEKEISYGSIKAAAEHDMDVLDIEGRKLRQQAAIAADEAILRNTPQGARLQASVVDVQEMEPNDKSQMMPRQGKAAEEINESRRVEDQEGKTDRRGRVTTRR